MVLRRSKPTLPTPCHHPLFHTTRLGADKEATPPPRWPLEVTISTVALKTQQEARGHLLHLW